MSTSRPRRTLPAFTLLAALLVTPAAANARPSQPQREVRPPAVASASFLAGPWHGLTSRWGATGMSIDPWGRQAPTSGGSIDPNGRVTNSLSGNSGASIDPNGEARPFSGGSIDPWGHGAPTSHLAGDTGMSIDPNG
jgi:hypothetical protein